MQPKTPLFTSDSQHPPRFRHAVYLGVDGMVAQILILMFQPTLMPICATIIVIDLCFCMYLGPEFKCLLKVKQDLS